MEDILVPNIILTKLYTLQKVSDSKIVSSGNLLSDIAIALYFDYSGNYSSEGYMFKINSCSERLCDIYRFRAKTKRILDEITEHVESKNVSNVKGCVFGQSTYVLEKQYLSKRFYFHGTLSTLLKQYFSEQNIDMDWQLKPAMLELFLDSQTGRFSKNIVLYKNLLKHTEPTSVLLM